MSNTKALMRAHLQELIAKRESIHAELQPARDAVNRYSEDVAAIKVLIDEQADAIKARAPELFALETEISELARVTGGKFISDDSAE